MESILFQTTDWATVPVTEHRGEQGIAWWQTKQYDGLRIRLVEYSAGYRADHWCKAGHIVYCIEGEMISELADGRVFILSKGMTYQVSDNVSMHHSYSEKGVKLLIIDGDFLKLKNNTNPIFNPWKI